MYIYIYIYIYNNTIYIYIYIYICISSPGPARVRGRSRPPVGDVEGESLARKGSRKSETHKNLPLSHLKVT